MHGNALKGVELMVDLLSLRDSEATYQDHPLLPQFGP